MEKCLCEKIKRLEKRIQKLEKNYVPNQELRGLRDRLIHVIMKGNFFPYYLNEGSCRLDFPKILDMLNEIKDKGNFYILLCGSSCAYDVGLLDFDSDIPTDTLDDLYIKRIFDTRIDKDKAYLIALEKINQKDIPDENIVMFTREYIEEKPETSDLPEIDVKQEDMDYLEGDFTLKWPDIEIRKETDVKDPLDIKKYISHDGGYNWTQVKISKRYFKTNGGVLTLIFLVFLLGIILGNIIF